MNRFLSKPIFSLLRCRLFTSSNLLPTATHISSDLHYASLIDSCLHISQISQIHAHLLSFGLLSRGFLLTKLIHACSRLGLVQHGKILFGFHPNPDIFLWNAAIKLHSSNLYFSEAISAYGEMLVNGIRPDRFTFSAVVRAFCGNRDVRVIHGQVIRHGFASDVFIQNGLLAVYVKSSSMRIARKVFDQMPEKGRDVVSWTCVISGFVQSGNPLEAIELFAKMRCSENSVAPDFIVLVSVLKASADRGEIPHGKALHGFCIKCRFDEEADVQASLVAFYSECGDLDGARAVFELSDKLRSLLLWNSIISGCAKNGNPLDGIKLFQELAVHPELSPDSITIRAAIMAAVRLGSLEIAQQVQSYVNDKEFDRDMLIRTSLIDMYSKCGSIELAHKIFNEMPEKDVVAWSAIISAYAHHGHGREAISLFHEMELSGVDPNSVTFLSLLSACNHSGLVSEGREIFAAMRAHNVDVLPKHYACMIDLLGRAGMVMEACELIAEMPSQPTVAAWGALLSACRSHGDVSTGELAATKVLDLDPLNVGHLVQLSNLFAGAGMWAGAGRVRAMMREKGLVKMSGESIVEVDDGLWTFKCDDHSHSASKGIYEMISMLEMASKEGGADASFLDTFLDCEVDHG